MYTVSNILTDIDRECDANNMTETCFSYRIIYFVNENGIGRKYYVDTPYEKIRQSLENIIKGNLTTRNTVVIAAVTVKKNGETLSLLSKSYRFNLNEYFRQICGKSGNDKRINIYGRYAYRQDRFKSGS